MGNNRKELEQKVAAATSPSEVEDVLRAAGTEITAEEAAQLFEKARERKTDKELSLDELEAVSGGVDRDWLVDGCAATVENGSRCGSNDKCLIWDVVYEHPPIATCEHCGGVIYESSDFWAIFQEVRCVNCGPNYRR